MSILNTLQAGQFRLGELKPGSLPKSMAAGKNGDSGRVLSAVQNQVLESLASHIPGMDAKGIKSLDPNQYTPEKVSDRIANFVAQGLEMARARGASEEKIQHMYEQAVKGARQGFEEAKEILSHLDILQGKIAEDVEKTERLTFDALARLDPSKQLASDLVVMSAAERYARADSMVLSVTTQSGKQVSIRFDHAISQDTGMAVTRDGDGNRTAVFDISRSEQSNFQFSIQGDLTADEIDAIQNLVRDVSLLANEFFSGDVQKAFEQAGSLSFDGSQLSSMNLTMTRTEVYAVAQRYEQTSQLDQGDADSRPAKRLEQLMQGLAEKMNEQALAFLSDQKSMVEQLMERLVEQDSRFKLADEPQQERYRENLGRMLQSLRES